MCVLVSAEVTGLFLLSVSLLTFCAPQLWSLCFGTKGTWIFWHAPEAMFSEQDWNESLGKQHQFNCVYLSLLSLSLPSLFSVFFPLRLASGNTEMMKGTCVFFSLSLLTFIMSLFTFPVYTPEGRRQASDDDDDDDAITPHSHRGLKSHMFSAACLVSANGLLTLPCPDEFGSFNAKRPGL